MRRLLLTAIGILLGPLHAGPLLGGASDMAAEARKILRDNCFKCHGSEKQSSKLDARQVESLIEGGKRGAAIVPGDAGASRLIDLIQPDAKPHMPPGKNQLTGGEIAALVAWIDGMAPRVASVSDDPRMRDDPTGDRPERWAPPAGVDPSTVIDLLLQAGYRRRGITPNRLCDDPTFARRIYLDLTGRIPTVEQLDAFLADTDSAKRTELVDHLLHSERFAERMAESFDVMLMGRVERRVSDRVKHGWQAYLRAVFRENRPWDEVARQVLLARGHSKQRGHLWFLYERENDHRAIAESIAKGFFGIDIACAQCHDHPLADEIQQSHYWGLVAFFNRGKNTRAENGIAIRESAIGGFGEFSDALSGSTQPAALTFLGSDVIHEARPADPQKQEDREEFYVSMDKEPPIPVFSRREKFVDQVLHDHPLLARSMVNRIWALMMGRGIVHPIDEMDSTNPPSHPMLLEWLARDFADNGYDIRRLVRAVVLSRAYQLRSRTPPRAEPASFAHALEKPLSAEAYTRSIAIALGIDSAGVSDMIGSEFRQRFPEVVSENALSNLKQTLALSNYPPLQQLINDAGKSLVDERLPPANSTRQLFRRIYGRQPAEDEQTAIIQYIARRHDRLAKAWAQVTWAMLCSAEFRFNH